MTSEHSRRTSERYGTLILSVEGSPARTYPLLGEGEDSLESGLVFGGKCDEWLRPSDQNMSSLKTRPHCSIEDSITFCVTLPNSGMMRSGMLYQLRNSDLPTAETESLLLPTPTASDGTGQGAIMPQWDTIVRDGVGFPRRLDAKTGGTWSVGLARFTQYAVFLPLIPELSEWLMGFPSGWTVCDQPETPLFPPSPNGSVGECET